MIRPPTRFIHLAPLFMTLLLAGAPARAAEAVPESDKTDRYIGYYYPRPATVETYVSRARIVEGSDRRRRIGFVVAFETQLQNRPYTPEYAIFTKGDEANRLIVVGYGAGRFDTLYRARALLASLTSMARTTPFFQEFRVEDLFTFLDLLKVLGFESVTVSDGADFAHQILIK